MTKFLLFVLIALLATTACTPKPAPVDSTPTPSTESQPADDAAAEANKPADTEAAVAQPSSDSVESTEILARAAVTDHAMVQHVLISWDEMASTYAMRGGQDPRGAARTLGEANELASSVLQRAQAGEEFAALMREVSEDPGSARTAREYTVTPTASLVEPFKTLSLRLQPEESGIVRSDFGYHVIYRTK